VIPMVVVLPLAGACAAWFAGRHAPLITLLATVATAAVAGRIAVEVWRVGPVTEALGGWDPPLGIPLRADGFAAALLLAAAAVVTAVLGHASAYLPRRISDPGRENSFWVLALLLWAGLNALFLSGDVFNLYVCLEMMTLAAIALILLEGDESALNGAFRYLLAGFLGSTFYLLGVAILYAAYGRLDLAGLAETATANPPTWVAAALIAGALALKAALFPLHFWLPRAHSAAPAPVSALLSSLVVTAGFYLFMRLFTTVFAYVMVPAAGTFIGMLGAAAIVWGSLQAMRQRRLKVLIAYSTVAQVGYAFLSIPIVLSAIRAGTDGAEWGTMAWSGAIYHAVAHGLAKAAMFLAAGNIVLAMGSDRIVGISGIARQLPMTTYAFGMAGMTLIGLPPSGGFVAKWLLVSAALASGQWWWAVVLLLGGILTAGYVFIVLGQELSLAESDRVVGAHPVPARMEVAAFTLAVVSLLLGFGVSEPLALLRAGAPLGSP